MEKSISKYANNIFNHLAVIIKLSQIHDYNNVALIKGIIQFNSIINSILMEETSVTLEIVNDFFYINKMRIKYESQLKTNIDFLLTEFKRREIGGITFTNKVTSYDIKLFLHSFAECLSRPVPFDSITKLLKTSEAISIEPLKFEKKGELDGDGRKDELGKRKMVKKTYFYAVSVTKEIMSKIKSGEKSSLKRAKRMIESIVDNVVESESLLIGLTMIKDYDDYTYYHSVNVSILSMALGCKIGMDKKATADLGMAALFHDMGKVNIPDEILNKPGSLTDDEWLIMKQHPVWGLKSILNVKGFDENSILSAIVAFEHHMHYNLTGYPSVNNKSYKLNLYSKIVSIADQYDAITSSRVYSRTPTPLNKALSILLSNTNTQLDPYLTKVFINMVGVYPIGSLIILNTGDMGIVFKSNPNPAFIERPKVIVVLNREGYRMKKEVDLMEKDKNNNNFKYSIIKVLDPYKYKINLANYLLN